MGDTHENAVAWEMTVGRAMPLYLDALDPQKPAGKIAEAFEVHDIATADVATSKRRELNGYALHLAVVGTTPGAAVRVRFANGGVPMNGITLYPGDFVRVARGFEVLFLESAGAAGTLRLIVERDPFSRVERRPPSPNGDLAFTWAGGSVFVSPLNGVVLADTGALAAGDYEFIAQYGGYSSTAWSVGFQHRDAANAATLKEFLWALVVAAPVVTMPRYTLAANERLRWITKFNTGGDVAASIWYRRVA